MVESEAVNGKVHFEGRGLLLGVGGAAEVVVPNLLPVPRWEIELPCFAWRNLAVEIEAPLVEQPVLYIGIYEFYAYAAQSYFRVVRNKYALAPGAQSLLKS